MGFRYNINRTKTALSTSADLLTITAAAARTLKIWSISIGGMDTTSTANEIAVYRSTSGATPVALTLATGNVVPKNPNAPALTSSVYQSWTTYPTTGVVVDRLNVNSNGAIDRRVFPPGAEIDIPAGGQISIRSVNGTGNVTLSVDIEEI